MVLVYHIPSIPNPAFKRVISVMIKIIIKRPIRNGKIRLLKCFFNTLKNFNFI